MLNFKNNLRNVATRVACLAASMIVGVMLFISCEKDDNPSGGEKPGKTVFGKMENINLEGIVLAPDGSPLNGVKVISGTKNFTTGSDGLYNLSQADVVNGRVSVRFEKSGYFTITRSQRKGDSESIYIEAALNPTGNSGNSARTTFESTQGTTVSLSSGMKIEFPAASIMRSDGTAFNGKATVEALYLAPNNDLFPSMMNGDIAVMRKDGKKSAVISNGIINVVLKDDAGKSLQLKTGSKATLTFPIPANSGGSLPATLPVCSYNEAEGIWKEETTATRQGTVYVATVDHFSQWNWANCDLEIGADVLQKVKVVDCEGKPFPKALITIEQKADHGTTLYKGLGVTNSKGMADVICLTYSSATVTAEGKGLTDSKTTMPIAEVDDLAPLDGLIYTKETVTLTLCEFVKSGTVEFYGGDDKLYLNFDNFGQQRRWDVVYANSPSRDVIIYDEINSLYVAGQKGGTDEEWTVLSQFEASVGAQYQLFEKYNKETFMIFPFITMIGGTKKIETVAGQKCEVFRLEGVKWAVWGGSVLLWFGTETDGQMAIAASKDCHPKAFTKTFIY